MELLNLLARAAGLRNFATLKAHALAAPASPSGVPSALPVAPAEGVDAGTLSATARKALLQFDQATLRRELVNMKLLGREGDCSRYWKEPHRPEPEVPAFLQAWRAGLR